MRMRKAAAFLFLAALMLAAGGRPAARASEILGERDVQVNLLQPNPRFEAWLKRRVVVSYNRFAEKYNLERPGIPVVLAEADGPADFSRMMNGGVRDWAVGAASPSRRLIGFPSKTLRLPPDRLALIVDHEVCHLVIGQKFLANRNWPPLWLQEGVAVMEAEAWDFGFETQKDLFEALAGAVQRKELFKFSELDYRFPEGAASARTAYAQSYLLASYLSDAYGERAFVVFVDELSKGFGAEGAAKFAFGMVFSEIEQSWRRRMSDRFGVKFLIMNAAANPYFFYGVVALLLIPVSILVRARRRRLAEEGDEGSMGGEGPYNAGEEASGDVANELEEVEDEFEEEDEWDWL